MLTPSHLEEGKPAGGSWRDRASAEAEAGRRTSLVSDGHWNLSAASFVKDAVLAAKLGEA